MSATRDQIYKSTQAQYTSDGLQDSMRVEAMVVLDESDQDLVVAQQLRKATNDYFNEDARRFYSPGHYNLPLQRINSRHVAPGLVQLTIDYGGRSVVGGGQAVVDFQTVQVPVTVFAQPGPDEVYENGLPMGETIGVYTDLEGNASTSISTVPADIVNQMRVDTHERNCVRILLRRSEFGNNPISRFKNAIRKVNANPISLGGINCPAGSLLFEGIDSKASTIGVADPTGQVPSEQLIYDYAINLLFDVNKFPIQRWRPVEGDDDGLVSLQIEQQYEVGDWFL